MRISQCAWRLRGAGTAMEHFQSSYEVALSSPVSLVYWYSTLAHAHIAVSHPAPKVHDIP
jgi:hypothetical protein